MSSPERTRGTRLSLTALLWACVLFSLAALPSDRFPALWLLALTLPACLFLELQKRSARAFGLGIGCLLQLLAGYAALHLAGPLEQASALAGTLLPPLAYVTARRQDTDILLALFLSFCLLLVGLMLGGNSLTLLGYVPMATLTVRLEVMADLMSTRTSHWMGSRRGLGSGSVLLALSCGLACLGFYPLLGHLPSLGTQPVEVTRTRSSLGLSPNFELGTALGSPLNQSAGQLLRVRSTFGGPLPADLYLRCAFFDVPGMDSWSTESFDAQIRTARSGLWRWRRPITGVRSHGLEIQRLEGFRGLVFAPPGTTAIDGLDNLRTETSREWFGQDPDARAAIYEVYYQDLRPLVAGQATDTRWQGLRVLPPELRIPALTQLLDEVPRSAHRYPASLANALIELIQARCTYALQEPQGPHPHALLNFLHGTQRRGYCMHFASALGILLRLAGVPCRIAVGLYGGYPDVDDPEFRRFDAPHAHAWVEIPFPELGWVVFDPTPPALLQATGETLVPELEDMLEENGAISAPGNSLADTLETALSQIWIWSLLLIIWLFAALRPRLRFRTPRSESIPPETRPARRWLDGILKTLAARNLPRPRGQTLERYFRDLKARAVLDEIALADAFNAYQEVRFGTRNFDGSRLRRLKLGILAARAASRRETEPG